jgi:hypothetical protein
MLIKSQSGITPSMQKAKCTNMKDNSEKVIKLLIYIFIVVFSVFMFLMHYITQQL